MRAKQKQGRDGGLRRPAALALMLLLCLGAYLACGIWVSYFYPQVRTFQVQAEGLEAGVRLAVLSDLHDRRFGGDNAELVRLVEGQSPDLILLAGDILNGYSQGPDTLLELAEALTETAPVYFAWGNHELDYLAVGTSDLTAELSALGVTVLEESFVDLTVNGAELRLGGLYGYAFAMDDYNTCSPANMDPDTYAFLTRFQATGRYKIMVSHRPDSFIFGAASTTWDVDLVVSGHDHGGQVVLPFLGGLYGGDQGFFPTYIHGIYEKDGLTLAITSGLGTQKERLPRFADPPEIMVLDLIPA